MNTRGAFTIIFMVVFSINLIIFGYNVNLRSAYQQGTSRYEAVLRSSSAAGMEAAKGNMQEASNDINTRLFALESTRQYAANAFFTTLYQSLGATYDSITQSELQYRIPMMCLMDYNGYYIGYNSASTTREGHFVVSGINTWTTLSKDPYQRYIIQYYLGDECNVTVTDRTKGNSYTAPYDQVYKYFGSPTALDVIKTKKDYENSRIDVVMEKTTETMDIYIDQYNYIINGYDGNTGLDIHYDFTLPTIDRQNWANLMNKPSIIGFLQGPVLNDHSSTDSLNIYSFTGYEVSEIIQYPITKSGTTYTYHLSTCPHISSADIIGSTTSKKDAASRGAWPCEKCRP